MSLIDTKARTTANHNQTIVRTPSGLPQHNQTLVRPLAQRLAFNHNQTLILGNLATNHNQTIVRAPWGTTYQHNQTVVRR